MVDKFFKTLPKIESGIDGVEMHLLQLEKQQMVYMEFAKNLQIKPHSHSEQIGLVLDGEIELKIEDKIFTLKKGDQYIIPKGLTHSANIKAGYKDISIFDEPNRYKLNESRLIEVIDHFVINASNIKNVKKFYNDILALELVEYQPNRFALFVGNQKINIHLKDTVASPKAIKNNLGANDICFITLQPLEEIKKIMDENSIAIVEYQVKRTGANSKLTSMYVYDFDGNLIEIANKI